MVRLSLDEVTDEMVLGKSIFLPTGELLLAAGYRLTGNYRRRLQQLGFEAVYIHVPETEDVIPENIISEHVERELQVSFKRNVSDLKKSFTIRQEGTRNVRRMIRQNKQYLTKFLTNSAFINTLEKVIDEVLNQPSIVLNMNALRKTDDDLFSHAINVAVISLSIGRKYYFTYEEMKQLAMGAINYDLGLIAIPDSIRRCQGNFTCEDDFEMYMQHAVYGYLMLSQNPAITATSAAVALQHHEHQDGSGYPRNLHGENRPPLKDFSRKHVIHRFSEIVAVADQYDMLLSGRMCPVHTIPNAIRRLIELGGSHLNKEIVKTLTAIVPIYPVGAKIKIVQAPSAQLIGYYGVVARLNNVCLEKPQILLYQSKNHQKIKPVVIDLSQHTGFKLEVLT